MRFKTDRLGVMDVLCQKNDKKKVKFCLLQKGNCFSFAVFQGDTGRATEENDVNNKP